MKLLSSLSFSIVVTLVLFYLMQSLIKPPILEKSKEEKFYRVSNFQKVDTKESEQVFEYELPKERTIKTASNSYEKLESIDSKIFKPNFSIEKIELNRFKLEDIDISEIEPKRVTKVSKEASKIDIDTLTIIDRVEPIYPRRAKLLKKEGFVELKFTILKSGYLKDIQVIESNPEGIFENVAIDALSQWRFQKLNRDYSADIKIEFNLKR